jgi:hypothetical protein
MLKTLLPQLQPHLYPQPPAPSTPAAAEAALPAPATEPVPPAPPAAAPKPRAPVKEKPDDATSKADPLVKQPPPLEGGFPEDLEPSVVLPVPITPEPAPAQVPSEQQ